MTIYYTYCSYETDKGTKSLYYIGSRKCPAGKTPETDNYFGSPKSPKNKEFKDNPNKDKVILGVFDNKEEALAHEIWLHDLHDVAVNPTFANQAKQTSTKFSTAGLTGEDSPSFGRRGEMCPAYHRRGDKHHFYGMRGEGTPMFGKKHTPGALEKMSKAQSGENNPMFGRTGEDNPRYGVPLPKETKDKISASLSGEKSPLFGKKGEDCHNFGKKRSPETRQQMSERWIGEKNPNYGNGWKMGGEKNHNFNPTEYSFINIVSGSIEDKVTGHHMIKKYNLDPSSVTKVIKGKQLVHRGWSLHTDKKDVKS